MSFKLIKQHDSTDCGPACLRMILGYYNNHISSSYLSQYLTPSAMGVSMLDLENTAKDLGYQSRGVRMTLKQLVELMPLPCILHWNNSHFVVCYNIKKKKNDVKFYIADPATNKFVCNLKVMVKCWLNQEASTGAALSILPDIKMIENSIVGKNVRNGYIKALYFFVSYLKPYRKSVMIVLLNMLVGCLLQLIFPFLSQYIVDFGIEDSNESLIGFILIGQFCIALFQTIITFLQNWFLLHINTRIHITIISDFLYKLMKLPIEFFSSKNIGDILQRIGDHNRIEAFLMNSSISTVFSFFTFTVFLIVLLIYNVTICGVFLLGNTLYILWILIFLSYRSKVDALRFAQASGEQSNLIQLITGMPDIKLGCCERQKRWEWERIQLKLLDINIKSQTIQQIQQCGSIFFSQSTNIFISYITAISVISGDMTLGMMVSLTYIVGAINIPINNFINFIRQFQDAKLSVERLKEIHEGQVTEDKEDSLMPSLSSLGDIKISNLSFSYSSSKNCNALKDISAMIPAGKVTAVVGASGSGKTTLLKLLMGFYDYSLGEIKIGDINLNKIDRRFWRKHIGSVLQDGFIFSDTIESNITLGHDEIDENCLRKAIIGANLQDFIDLLPLKEKTKIGMEGHGLSQGQRQRILLARVFYKNPQYVFLDEATNALDANNERIIIENLKSFYVGKTVVIAAHRLSTVASADYIIVLEHGRIVENGTHASLIRQKGLYFNLINSQLKLS